MDEYVYIFGGAIGDSLLGVHIGRLLAANLPHARITMVTTRRNPFLRELLAPIPFVTFKELPKESISAWLQLPWFMMHPHKVVVYEPFTSPMPLWWRLILWCLSRHRGSIEVHYQSRPGPVPKRAKVLQLQYLSESVFDTPVKVLAAWGVPVSINPKPHLDVPEPAAKDKDFTQAPYVVFHFFAGVNRRSISVSLAKELLSAARVAFPNYGFVITAAHKDASRAAEMIEGISNTSTAIGFHAVEALRLLKGATVFVGVDTGFAHIAQHLHVPTIVLGHTINPSWLPRYSPPVTVLYSVPDIMPATVIEAIQTMLQTHD